MKTESTRPNGKRPRIKRETTEAKIRRYRAQLSKWESICFDVKLSEKYGFKMA